MPYFGNLKEAGDFRWTKIAKAKNIGISIITENEFLQKLMTA
jgi:hypothetical protein